MTEPRNNGKATTHRVPPVEYQFKPGNPGRPKGSRNKLGEDFIAALHEDFLKHGKHVIETVRDDKPHQYLRVIAAIIPKEFHVKPADWSDVTDEELEDVILALRQVTRTRVSAKAGNGTGEAEGETPTGGLAN